MSTVVHPSASRCGGSRRETFRGLSCGCVSTRSSDLHPPLSVFAADRQEDDAVRAGPCVAHNGRVGREGSTMSIASSTTLHTSFDDAVHRTREALAQKGFGVLTKIDMKATLKAKLGEDMEDYLILGACNPQFAIKRSISAGRSAYCCRAMLWCAETAPRRTLSSSTQWTRV
jgi:Domain of unknown function DUF302